jgi:cytosine/adenosine deaminase-related metal-dependent hydrolase
MLQSLSPFFSAFLQSLLPAMSRFATTPPDSADQRAADPRRLVRRRRGRVVALGAAGAGLADGAAGRRSRQRRAMPGPASAHTHLERRHTLRDEVPPAS